MPIRICHANTPSLLDGVYKVRHHVFCVEEGKMPATEDERIVDRFDGYPTSRSVAVVHNSQVIGSMRFSVDSEVGLPADEYFDFRRHLPDDAILASCGMFCVQKAFRGNQLSMGLMLMSSYLALSGSNATHIAAPVNPAIAALMQRVGFQSLGSEFVEPHTKLKVKPMLLDIKELNDYFLHFVKSNDLYNFLCSYECYLFSAGEQVIHSGTRGDMAYVIIEGEVEVRNGKTLLATLCEGDIFGELSLLTNGIRSADVWASTNVKTMTLDKESLLKHIQHDPVQAMKLFNMLGQRIKALNDKIATF